jgi:hypothetical protein
MFYRAEGQLVADWLYPQYKQVYDKKKEQIIDRTTTARSNMRTLKIVGVIMQYIEIKGYCIEKDIVQNLIQDEELRITKGEAEKQIKKSLKEILDIYDLKRIRANKEVKNQYGIVSEGYPFLIVKNV